jgi:CRISPR-associated protein (TIGR02710 family)
MQQSLNSQPKAMVLSVGGTAAPIVTSLNQQQPPYVCFFVSAESRRTLEAEVLPALSYPTIHHDWIETPSAENLVACCRVLLRELPRIAEHWQIPLTEFVADYTAGTKTMSVALGMATLHAVRQYTYVGGASRTKEGLGTVIDGSERMRYLANPWDALAVEARRRASLLFAKGRYEAAAEEYELASDRVSAGERGVWQGFSTLARGYAEWDRFAHGRAQELLQQSLKVLEPWVVGSGDPAWARVAEAVRRHADLLVQMRREEGGILRVADLVANARRRGDLEARYDDAVARLYSALEMAGRLRLTSAYDIHPSHAVPGKIPASLREEFCRKYEAKDKKGQVHLKLPHYAVFRLLAEFGDDLANRYFSREEEIRGLLEQRNGSILGHGDRPVSKTVYQRLLPVVCEVAALQESDLAQFPELPA